MKETEELPTVFQLTLTETEATGLLAIASLGMMLGKLRCEHREIALEIPVSMVEHVEESIKYAHNFHHHPSSDTLMDKFMTLSAELQK